MTTYKGKKTTYDAAVKKADTTKADFFATLFSKKAALPLRPTMPTAVAAYSGLYQSPILASGAYVGPSSQNDYTKVLANEFVVDGSHVGWGSWTFGLLPHATFPVAKSFGVFGYGDQTSSFVQNWLHMCVVVANTGSNGFCPLTTTVPPRTPSATATAIKQVLVVSLWANDAAAAAFTGASSLKVTFALSNWSQNAALWKKPTTPEAGVAPTDPKGAKALVASAAAAVAIAASLY